MEELHSQIQTLYHNWRESLDESGHAELAMEYLQWVIILLPGLWFDLAWGATVSYNRSKQSYGSYIYAMVSCVLVFTPLVSHKCYFCLDLFFLCYGTVYLCGKHFLKAHGGWSASSHQLQHGPALRNSYMECPPPHEFFHSILGKNLVYIFFTLYFFLTMCAGFSFSSPQCIISMLSLHWRYIPQPKHNHTHTRPFYFASFGLFPSNVL